MPLKHIRTAVELKQELVRTKMNYEADVKEGDYTNTGVKEECIFNQLKSYDVTENQSCDLMHDWLLGILRYNLALLFNHIIDLDLIGLNALNAKILSFDYGYQEKDKPPKISHHLRNNQLSMYTSEMLTLVLHLLCCFYLNIKV